MNCKKGDLVVQVKSMAGNEGKIFTCLRLATQRELKTARFRLDLGPIWVIDRPINVKRADVLGVTYLVFDLWLRPIRDTPGGDESLQWAPVPGEKVTA